MTFGEAAKSVAETLRGQPQILGMLLLVGALLGYIFYIQGRQLDTRDRNLQQLFEAQKTIFDQWGKVFSDQSAALKEIIRDQVAMSDKMIKCVTIDDALKLMRRRESEPQPQQ